MAAYYNEYDKFAAAWLRNLIAEGHIAPGDVDERSIEDVSPADLVGYRQCHFFAGVGVWSYALRRAGVSDDTPVWTGSCPCQPFSSAGEGAGFADERHLWPAFFHLIEQCRPPVVLGEQVAGKDAEPWVDLVHADLEAVGYAFGAVPFPAAGVGAPHIRDRLYWAATDGVAQGDTIGTGLEGHGRHGDDRDEPGWVRTVTTRPIAAAGATGGLDDTAGPRHIPEGSGQPRELESNGGVWRGLLGVGRKDGGLADAGSWRLRRGQEHREDAGAPCEVSGEIWEQRLRPDSGANSATGRLADTSGEVDSWRRDDGPGEVACEGAGPARERPAGLRAAGRMAGGREPAGSVYDADTGAGPVNGFWRAADWLFCRDGRWRPVEPGTFPLVAIPAPGLGPVQPGVLKLARSNRTGRLRGYGNAICAEAAIEFIRCVIGAQS